MAAAAIRFENWVNGTLNSIIIYNPSVNLTYVEYDDVESSLWLGITGYPVNRLEIEFPSPTDLYNFVWADTGLNWALTTSSSTSTVYIGSNQDIDRSDAPTTTTTTAAPTTTTTTAPTTTTTTVPGGTTTTTTAAPTTTTTTAAPTTTTTTTFIPGPPSVWYSWAKADDANAVFEIYINDSPFDNEAALSRNAGNTSTKFNDFVDTDTLDVRIVGNSACYSKIWIRVVNLQSGAEETKKAPDSGGYGQGYLQTVSIIMEAGKAYYIEAETVTVL